MYTFACNYCGKIVQRSKRPDPRVKNHYCSKECFHKSLHQKNQIENRDNYAVLLISYKGEIKEVKISIEDIPKVSLIKWHIHRHKSSKRESVMGLERNNYKNRKHFLLSRFLLNCPDDKEVDHINHDTLDNRRENLRIVTKFENQQNKRTSGKYVGVVWDKSRNKWKATVEYKKKRFNLGRFKTEEEAARVRIQFIKENNII